MAIRPSKVRVSSRGLAKSPLGQPCSLAARLQWERSISKKLKILGIDYSIAFQLVKMYPLF